MNMKKDGSTSIDLKKHIVTTNLIASNSHHCRWRLNFGV